MSLEELRKALHEREAALGSPSWDADTEGGSETTSVL
jgi:hypothetical protein